jgi:hypothetical protein
LSPSLQPAERCHAELKCSDGRGDERKTYKKKRGGKEKKDKKKQDRGGKEIIIKSMKGRNTFGLATMRNLPSWQAPL